MKDVASRVSVYSLSGQVENEIALPGVGTTAGFGGNPETKLVRSNTSDKPSRREAVISDYD